MSRPAFVVLAAGESARLGRCKATVPIGGRPAIDWLLDAGRAADGARPLIVCGAHAEEIAAVVGPRAELLVNRGWRAGRTGGIALAVAARAGQDLVLAPVDAPLVPAEVVDALVDEWLRSGAPPRGWLAPAVRSAASSGAPSALGFGHPVAVGRELLSRLAGFGSDEPLRRLRDLAEPCWWVEVGSTAILDNADDAAALSRLASELQASRHRSR
jgi:molybdenum cofactor cytidylyltransferase